MDNKQQKQAEIRELIHKFNENLRRYEEVNQEIRDKLNEFGLSLRSFERIALLRRSNR